ncbi:MAG TPA: AI-2E family transporter [Blastocatellia bacterium]|nr:AI-2E family transporter [Blastocatellia bacterium]
MATKRTTIIFLLLVTGTAVYFCFVLARPFLDAIAWAMVIAVLFFPVHNAAHKTIRNPNAAAMLSVALVLLTFIIPAVLLGRAMAGELKTLYGQANGNGQKDGGWPAHLTRFTDDASAWIAIHIGADKLDLRKEAAGRLEQLSESLGTAIANWLGNAASILVECVFILFIAFFVFRDGLSLKERLGSVLPLTHEQVERLFRTISETLIAEMYGVLAVAIAQGLLMGLGFWALGLPSPVLWGTVTAVVSLVPVGGTAFVWIPGAIILIASGHWIKGLVLLGWGAGFVSLLAAITQPLIIGRRVKLHPLEIFLGLLGGIEAFGLIGLFAGPIIISLTLALFDILKEEVRSWRSGEAEDIASHEPDRATVVIETVTPSG